MNYASQHEYDQAMHRRNSRKAYKARMYKRWNNSRRTIEKPGVQPVSTFHPHHPARLYGWDDDRCINRDRRKWQ